jgi:hypothetical protein
MYPEHIDLLHHRWEKKLIQEKILSGFPGETHPN